MSPLDRITRFLATNTEMSSARNQPIPQNPQYPQYPPIPSSLNAGDHEMREWPPTNAPPNTLPYYTPYLGLRARLSQVCFNRWTVLLLLIVARLLLAIKGLNYDLANAKTEALSACTAVENAGSTMASMPHYLSQGVNALAADGVTKAVSGLMDMIMLTVTGVEEIVVFWINMMTATYLCLITLAVSGSLHVAIALLEEVAAFANKSITDLTSGMSNDIASFQNGLNAFLATINIGGLLGSSKTAPKIDLSADITALNNIKIDPTQFDADLTKLNASIPTFADVQNFTETVIRLPFEEVKKLINETLPAYTFDKTVFPVAQKTALTFCTDDPAINNFFDGLVKVILTARTIFLAILIIAAIAVCIPMGYLEIRRWNKMQERADMMRTHAVDKLDALYLASRPYTAEAGIKLGQRFKRTKAKILARWFIAYATSLPALFILALGIAGLFSCLCQFIILRIVQKEAPELANQVGNFTQDVVVALNNASTLWAKDANTVINSTNVKINQDVFGWVNTTTHALNDTLNAFSDDMVKVLNATFGGTILYDPITEVMNCLIGLKIAGIEKGLTWVSDNAYVTFPEFRPDVFSLGAAASVANTSSTDSFLANPGDVASNGITSAIVKVINKLNDGIREEAIISTCVLLVWFLAMFGGLGTVLYYNFMTDKTRAEGGPGRYGEDENLSPEAAAASASAAAAAAANNRNVGDDHVRDVPYPRGNSPPYDEAVLMKRGGSGSSDEEATEIRTVERRVVERKNVPVPQQAYFHREEVRENPFDDFSAYGEGNEKRGPRPGSAY